MKRFLNTLFVTTQKSYLKKEGETVVVKVGKEKKARIPIINLQGIVCFGNVAISPFLMGLCAQRGVTITHLSEYGRFLARIQGPVAGNVLLRKEQYRISDDTTRSAAIAKTIVLGKLVNSRSVIQRAVRDHGDKINAVSIERAIEEIGIAIGRVQNECDLEAIRGIEGDTARLYFGVFNELITAQKADFTFRDRNRRPPLDRVNALLSFVYTLLYHDMRSALESCGLDPAVGFLHRDRPGRMSLALDMMEEFRPFFADRLVLSLINLKQVRGKAFLIADNGAVTMDDETRKTVLTTYQTRKQDVVHHLFIAKDMHIGILFQVQALLMARFIRGDIDGYPPYFWR
jgi:CRISPR-associated protein Cas1